MRLHALISSAAAATLVLAASGCAVSTHDDTSPKTGSAPSAGSAGAQPKIKDVVLVTHDSWNLPKKLVAQWEQQTGYHLVVRASGDAGKLTNKLVLTQGDPDGDVSFGVDNTFASRALKAGVFAPYTPSTVPAGAGDYDLEGDGGQHLTPIDHADVCVNVDTSWFTAHHLAPPATLDDLTKPAYKNLFVTPGASTSSPGMAFLLATIAKYGDGWPEYWSKLMANGAAITEGWDQAYEVDFTQGGGHGKRPIVLSYDSDPAYTVQKDGSTTTAALLDTCFTDVEYAGVLTGAKNAPGAQAFVDWLLTPAVQAKLPGSMYGFPVADGTPLPASWAKYAKQPTAPLTISPAVIDANREKWLEQWSDVTSR
jgi:thiamine transport system substrate-binding protein